MTAVAVWDHEPDPESLLERRLARGWVPTATATRDGPVVLGHGARAGGCRPTSKAGGGEARG